MNSSYRLPSGVLIFAFERPSSHYLPWRIGFVKVNQFSRDIVVFPPFGRLSYKTEEDAKKALRAYADEHGLEPAY